MRSIEEKIDIAESRKDDFRREIMNYIGALAVEGKTFDYKTNERLHKALELKLFEDQKDTIKLTSLVSSVVDRETQEKIDIVKQRLIRTSATTRVGHRRAQLRRVDLRPRRADGALKLCSEEGLSQRPYKTWGPHPKREILLDLGPPRQSASSTLDAVQGAGLRRAATRCVSTAAARRRRSSCR
jgi:hypothetical protein